MEEYTMGTAGLRKSNRSNDNEIEERREVEPSTAKDTIEMFVIDGPEEKERRKHPTYLISIYKGSSALEKERVIESAQDVRGVYDYYQKKFPEHTLLLTQQVHNATAFYESFFRNYERTEMQGTKAYPATKLANRILSEVNITKKVI
jgi:hypothetical protein